ncbi:TlpA family protein disulfide reductase [Flavobacterium agrisoli]|uniref:TlpA family protein disulfide reductase n=1 Tax=Flavobacterium agrisoli TaxID=2793066 RepID=A0A934PJM5_9FLAO|nr:TlpA disulfide reductase family protein [Flavobacterium agrisoli]MBK0369356.1 TlpA family protein disulfide reductase [Flavobacterium agrisoli]
MKKITYLFLLASLCSFAQTSGRITFTAKIQNRNSDTLIIRGSNKFNLIIPIDKKGVFEATFEGVKGFYQFSDKKEVSNLFLKPGDNLNLNMDASAFDETIVYTGKGADENNFLVQSALRDERFQESAFKKSPEEFEKLLAEKQTAEINEIDNGSYDKDFKEVYKKAMLQSNEYAKMEYDNTRKMNAFTGKPAPEFEYENHDGSKTKLSDLKGKYVYIDVWATWCGPCRMEIPYLKKAEEAFHGQNITFVSISIDAAKDHDKWKKFVTDKQLGGVQLLADKDWNSDFVTALGITGIPRFILLDPAGNILDANATRPSSGELENQLNAILKK